MKIPNLVTFTSLLFIAGTSLAFGQYAGTSQPEITVKTDMLHYDYGNTIVASGSTTNSRLEKISLRIFNPFNQPVINDEFDPKSDGSFSKSFLTLGPLWNSAGNYTLVVNQDSVTFSKISFYFSGRTNPGGIIEKIQSPLKQFKSGLTPKDVTCRQGLWLIFKTSDDSPACVKPEAAYILVHRGWANEISKTSLHSVPSTSSAPCDTPYPQSDVGVAVLYMLPNSTGKICAKYHNSKSPIQASVKVFAGRDMQQQASEITTSVYPDMLPTGNSTLVYTIKTGNQAGLYGISFFCGGVPFAVGYDIQSRIVLDDFPWLDKEYQCLYQPSIFQITGLSGIHVKYVTAVYRDQLDN